MDSDDDVNTQLLTVIMENNLIIVMYIYKSNYNINNNKIQYPLLPITSSLGLVHVTVSSMVNTVFVLTAPEVKITILF